MFTKLFSSTSQEKAQEAKNAAEDIVATTALPDVILKPGKSSWFGKKNSKKSNRAIDGLETEVVSPVISEAILVSPVSSPVSSSSEPEETKKTEPEEVKKAESEEVKKTETEEAKKTEPEEVKKKSSSWFGKKTKKEVPAEPIIEPVVEKNPIALKIFELIASTDGDKLKDSINVVRMITGHDHRIIGLPINAICTLLDKFDIKLIHEKQFLEIFDIYEKAKIEAITVLGSETSVLHEKLGELLPSSAEHRKDALRLSAIYRPCRHTKAASLKFYDPDRADDTFNYSEIVDYITLLRIRESLI